MGGRVNGDQEIGTLHFGRETTVREHGEHARHGRSGGAEHVHEEAVDHGHDHADDRGHRHGNGARWAKLGHGLGHLNPFGHSHEGSDSVDDALESSERGIRAIKISLLVLGITTLIQVAIFLASGSVALLADTLHNFVDAVNGIPLWIALAFAGRAATRRYTYGYGRAEDLAGLFIVVLIAVSAVLAGYETLQQFLDPQPIGNVGWLAGAAVIGLVGNEAVARYEMRVGREIGSAALVADGQHARVDGFTSLAVLGAAIGVWLGYPILDPIFGLFITIAIFSIVVGAARSMWRRMMDGIEPEVVDSIEEAASEIPHVESVESVRARWVGHRVYSEVRVRVPQEFSVAETDALSESISRAAKKKIPKLDRVVVEFAPGA
jgi:cation diffusion facilitator family transporter